MSLPIITSRRHPLVARCRDAADGRADEVLLDGPHLVADALATGLALAHLAVDEGARTRPEIDALLTAADVRAVPISVVTPAVMDALSPTRTPSGVVALARLSLSSLDAVTAADTPLVTVALGVQDPGNLGTLVRSSEAAGASGLVAAGPSAHPLSHKALRGAMGSTLRLPVAREIDGALTLDALSARGLRLLALDARAPLGLYDADLSGPLAVCVGAEGAGLSPTWLARMDLVVRIPMRAPVESLNVAVAASLVLFDVARRREGRS